MYPDTDNDDDRWKALGAVAGGLFGAFIGSELDLPGILLGAVVGSFLGAFLLAIGYPTTFRASATPRARGHKISAGS